MNDEAKKTIGGGQPSELTDKALDESALDAVSGGNSMTSKARAKKAWDGVKAMFPDDEEKEQQP